MLAVEKLTPHVLNDWKFQNTMLYDWTDRTAVIHVVFWKMRPPKWDTAIVKPSGPIYLAVYCALFYVLYVALHT